jgi:hypothetical protein
MIALANAGLPRPEASDMLAAQVDFEYRRVGGFALLQEVKGMGHRGRGPEHAPALPREHALEVQRDQELVLDDQHQQARGTQLGISPGSHRHLGSSLPDLRIAGGDRGEESAPSLATLLGR